MFLRVFFRHSTVLGSAGGTGRVSRSKRRIRLLEQENEALRRVTAHLSQANLPGK